MSKVKCFEVVSMLVKEATKRFSLLWQENNQKLSFLRECCFAIDKLAEKFNGNSYDVEINETSMEISVCLECDSAIITQKYLLYNLTEHTTTFDVSPTDSNKCNVKFVFPSIWDKHPRSGN